MTTLVIHTPDYKVRNTWPKSFEKVLADGIGEGYGIYEKYISILTSDCKKVVLLRKDKNRKRAEGIFIKLEKTERQARPGIWRYNVHIKGLTEVYYKPEKLNRLGWAII